MTDLRLCIKSGPSPLPRLEQLSGWWRGKIRTRLELANKATSNKERDEHLRAINEYSQRLSTSGG